MMGTMPISWRSRRQPVISESSTEAELYAQSECCSLGLSAAQYLTELGGEVVYSQTTDSRSALAQIAGGMSWRTRSLSCRARALRQRICQYKVYMGHIAGVATPADGLTKGLARVQHCKFLRLCCIGAPHNDADFQQVEVFQMARPAGDVIHVPDERPNAMIASSSSSSSSGAMSSNIGGDSVRMNAMALIDWAIANGRSDVEEQAKDLLLSLSVEKITPVAKVSVTETLQEFAVKSVISMASKALEGVAKGAETSCVPTVCPANEKEADEGMSKALIAVVAGIGGALTSFGVQECCRRRRRNVKKEKVETQSTSNRADCFCPKNRLPVGYEVVRKITGEGYEVVPHFVNPPDVVSVGVQTNVMCKEGRFKETKGVPSTATRVMTKQELIEACQDDEIEDMEAPVPLSSFQSRSSSSSSSSSYTVSTVNRNG
jgi:hypothetical protein